MTSPAGRPAPDSPPAPTGTPSTSTRSSTPKRKLSDAPLIPMGILILGGYLVWFGVHYWRADVKYPSDPIKALLQGKPIPSNINSSDTGEVMNFGKAVNPGGGGGGGRVTAESGPGPNAQIAQDALKYVGAGYVFGGNASSPGHWDCSSFVSYVLGHDFNLALPGGHWGDPGFPPHSHGPTTQTYLLYGSQISRTDLSAGDLVVWNTHMGIAISNSEIVAARTTSTGTGTSGIDGVTNELAETPHYRRVATPSGGPIVSV